MKYLHAIKKSVMPIDEQLANRVRELIYAATGQVEEKTMFGGLVFMVNDKICAGVKSDRMLVRIAPDILEQTAEAGELEPMQMGSRTSNSFGYVLSENLRTTKQLKQWIDRALAFNPIAEATKRRSPNKTRKK